MKAKALFLDRDGVINVDLAYVHRVQDCVFVEGIFDLVRKANQAGYIVAVVTNQAGIGRGYYTEAQFHAFMEWMRSEFAHNGARLDRIYYCPHHPDAGCACRKPAPGMLAQARAELDVDMRASILVGDRQSDIEAARRADVGRTFLLTQDETDQIAVDGTRRITSLRLVQHAL